MRDIELPMRGDVFERPEEGKILKRVGRPKQWRGRKRSVRRRIGRRRS